MLDTIKSFFTKAMAAPEEEEPEAPDVRLAACALLLELAHADDEFSDDEREHLEGVIQRHFLQDGDEEDAATLIRLAQEECARAVDLWQFTSLIASSYRPSQKMVLLEAMWGLVYADGDLASHEQYLMRKISHLLGMKPGYLSEAKKRVEKRGMKKESHSID